METYRITDDASVYFVTYNVTHWLPVFVSEASCRIITESLTYCHKEKSLRINAYVIMPTHFHAVVLDADHDSRRLPLALDAFRKYTGRTLADYSLTHGPPEFAEAMRETASMDRHRRFWQQGRHPEAITTENFWRQKVDYIHDNPCRKGLVLYPEHWRFSSARYYAGENAEGTEVPITELSW